MHVGLLTPSSTEPSMALKFFLIATLDLLNHICLSKADELWSFYSVEVDTSVKMNTFFIRILLVLQDYLVSIQNEAIMVLYMQPVQ